MITVKKSTDGFVFSHSVQKMMPEKALEELKYARRFGDSRFDRKIRVDGNTITVTRRKIYPPGPILTWIFEGPEEEITQLLAFS